VGIERNDGNGTGFGGGSERERSESRAQLLMLLLTEGVVAEGRRNAARERERDWERESAKLTGKLQFDYENYFTIFVVLIKSHQSAFFNLFLTLVTTSNIITIFILAYLD